MDALPAPSPEKTTTRDWSELPVDALSVVFAKLGAVEVLMGAGLVCRPWLDATKLPHLWRCVDIAVMKKKRAVLCVMADEAVKRADGQLEAFMAGAFVTNKLLKHCGGVKCGGFTPASRPPMTTSRRLRRRKSGDCLATAGPTGSTTAQIGPPEKYSAQLRPATVLFANRY
uniref:F-box domain-containing protein n=1 Tax=Oryza barthii TaxID=65489 RepID=A0A0D3GX45_9ORYZ